MEPRQLSTFRSFLPAILIMTILGWGGLLLLVNFSLPTIWPRWAFFAFWNLALTGTALPITWFLNLRFPGTPPSGDIVVIRQAIWVGLYGALLAWLQLGRSSTIWTVLGLAVGLIGIEMLIRIYERSRWVPPAARSERETAAQKPPADDQPA